MFYHFMIVCHEYFGMNPITVCHIYIIYSLFHVLSIYDSMYYIMNILVHSLLQFVYHSSCLDRPEENTFYSKRTHSIVCSLLQFVYHSSCLVVLNCLFMILYFNIRSYISIKYNIMSCCFVLFVYDLIFQYVIGQTREKIFAFAYTTYVYVMLSYTPYV